MTTTTTTRTLLGPTGTTFEVPTRYYETALDFRRIRNGWADVPAGEYCDHRDHELGLVALLWRRTGMTYQEVADTCGIQTFRMAEQVVRRAARTLSLPVPRSYARAARAVARRYGIEIEFNYNGYDRIRDLVTAELNAKGIDTVLENYNHTTRPHWKMTTDATVTGGELVSPIMDGTTASIEQVMEVIRTVKDCGGTTGRNVGMHVHHDVTDFTQEDMMRLVRTMQCVEDSLCAFVPEHRYNGANTYGARRIRDNDWNRLHDAIQHGYLLPQNARNSSAMRNQGCPVSRYSSVNWNSVLTYGTVELRLLGHTLNTTKVKTWLETTTAIFRAVKAGHELTGWTTVEPMLAWLRTNGGLSAATAAKYQEVVASRTGQTAAA